MVRAMGGLAALDRSEHPSRTSSPTRRNGVERIDPDKRMKNNDQEQELCAIGSGGCRSAGTTSRTTRRSGSPMAATEASQHSPTSGDADANHEVAIDES